MSRRKLGRDYEEAVRDIFRSFFPGASVHSGVWVVGPDGRRELDVHISEQVGDKLFRAVIECKDFNGATTGPVGVEYVDSLDSKCRDLGLDAGMLCSNAGFTGTAIRKARRLGIGLIAAVRMGDERIRFRVTEEIYVRHIRIKSVSMRFWPAHGQALPEGGIPVDDVTFNGRHIVRWFNVRFLSLLVMNPIVKGAILDSCRLTDAIEIEWPSGTAFISQVACEFEFDGAWFAQTVALSATEGTYDWLRKRMRLTPSPRPRQVQLVDFNANAGSWIERPEDIEQWGAKGLPHEVQMKVLVLQNELETDLPANLNQHIWKEDLELKMDVLPPDLLESTPGFAISPLPSPSG